MRFCRILALCLIATWASSSPALSCTEVFLSSDAGVRCSARNFDFMQDAGFLRFTPAGTRETAQYAPQGGVPLAWTSAHAALTFNTYFDKPGGDRGSSFLLAGVDGLNSAGLKVGTYFLPDSRFAASGPAKCIDIGMLAQYLLDRFASVDEALADLEGGAYRVTSLPTGGLEIKLHLFLHDAAGRSAIVEFLDGKTRVTRNPAVPVLANTPYAVSLEQLKACQGFGGDAPVPGGRESRDRFVRAAWYWKHLPLPADAAQAVCDGFSLMQVPAVSPGFEHGHTQWTIVTDIPHRRVYFRTFANPAVVSVDLAALASRARDASDVDLLRTDLAGDIGGLFTATQEFEVSTAPRAPDFTDPANWVALPRGQERRPVDVFFVHPTTYFFPNTWNESIEFGRENFKVAASLRNQASAFAASANVYMPHFRDAHIKALSASEHSKELALGVAYGDVERAFDHYLKHFNQGRPFILAGHSQGSDLLLMLLQRRFDDPKLARKLVAAYLIGWSVTPEDLKGHPFLKMSDSPGAVGAIISYNTQTAKPAMSIVRPGGIGVNPLTMSTSLEPVGKEANLGAVFITDEGQVEIPRFTGAQTVNGALVVPAPLDPKYVRTGFPGFYHSFDYSIFYRNIEADAARRVENYLKAAR